MFAVLQLNVEVEIGVSNRIQRMPLVYADGMIGAIPVFKTRQQAEAFAGDTYKIAELAVPETKA
jgi:hypothetical protein